MKLKRSPMHTDKEVFQNYEHTNTVLLLAFYCIYICEDETTKYKKYIRSLGNATFRTGKKYWHSEQPSFPSGSNQTATLVFMYVNPITLLQNVKFRRNSLQSSWWPKKSRQYFFHYVDPTRRYKSGNILQTFLRFLLPSVQSRRNVRSITDHEGISQNSPNFDHHAPRRYPTNFRQELQY